MTSVVAQYHSQSAGGSGANITVADTPAAGDVVFVALIGNRATPRTVTAISGLGATWTEVHNSGTSRYIVYRGDGATASGTVAITLSGTQNTGTSAWILRDLTSTTISAASFTTGAAVTSLAGPSQSAGSGQVVLASAVGTSNPTTFPSAQTPSGAYTVATGGTLTGTAYALPSSTASHQVSASSASATLYIGQTVVGTIGTTVPQVTGSTSVSVAGSATAAAVAVVAAATALTISPSAEIVPVGVTAADSSAVVQSSASVGVAAAGATTVTVQSEASAYAVGGAIPVTADTAVVVDSSATTTAVYAVSADTSAAVSSSATATGVASVAADASVSVESSATASDAAASYPVDLSTFVDLYASTTYDGVGLVGSPKFVTFADLAFDHATSYTVEVDYDGATGDTITLNSISAPTESAADTSTASILATSASVTGDGTLTLNIGPGIESWADAVAAGEHYLMFQAGALRITGIRVSPAMDYVVVPPEPVFTGTDTARREGGRSRDGLAVATWSPAVVPPPGVMLSSEHRRIRAQAFGPVTMNGTQPAYTVSEATAPRLRTRILVGGKDVSFFRGVPTPEPGYQLAEPLLWGPCTIELPQVAAAFETAGEGALSWCAKGKPVTLQRVTSEGTVVGVDYRGVVIGHDTSGKTLRIECGGHGTGRAALRHKPLPIFRDTLDLGRLAWAAIRDLGLRFEPRLGPTTGIKQALWGGMDHLAYISELCAKAFDRDGQWSLMPDEDATYRFARKDTATVHWTLYNDDARVVADLRSDAAEELNRVFASGVTPKGQRVRFGVYPGLKPGEPAPYPFADERTFGLGTEDADTDTGDGITVMVRKMWTAGYLSLEDATGLYDQDVTRALMSLQTDAGLNDSGNMNPATWAALFDLDVTGYTLRGSRIEPAAQDPRVQRYLRSASGQVIGKNPAFDRHKLVVDRAIDFPKLSRHQMREFSRAEVYRGEDNWVGTITINTGAVLRGSIDPGTEITEADIADVRDIRPGQNVRLPLFGGDILLHIAGVEITRNEGGRPVARLTVDTQARDAMPIWEIIRRNRETRRDAARRWTGNRASTQIKDSVTEWDEVGGVLYGDVNLRAGWNVIPVVAGQEGTVSRLRLVVQDVTTGGGDVAIAGREFACAVFGRAVTPKRLRTLIGNPLAASPESTAAPDPTDVDPPTTDTETDTADPGGTVTPARPWWERKDNVAALRDLDLLYSAGTHEDPCGYSPGRKSNGGTKTGLHRADAGFSYRTRREPVLYLAVWVWGERTLSGSRVMWPQLEAGA